MHSAVFTPLAFAENVDSEGEKLDQDAPPPVGDGCGWQEDTAPPPALALYLTFGNLGMPCARSGSGGTGCGPRRLKVSLCFPVNGEKVHLEEVLSKKQGIYQLSVFIVLPHSTHKCPPFPE